LLLKKEKKKKKNSRFYLWRRKYWVNMYGCVSEWVGRLV
jgi:hypothetical protein